MMILGPRKRHDGLKGKFRVRVLVSWQSKTKDEEGLGGLTDECFL